MDNLPSNIVQLFRANSTTACRQASDTQQLTRPNGWWRRSGFFLSTHERVRVLVSGWGNSHARVTHQGTLDELLACAAVTPKIAEQLKTKQKGKTLCDELGLRFRTLKKPSKTHPDHIRVERWGIHRGEQALILPGVRQLFPDGLFLKCDDEDPHKAANISTFRRKTTSMQPNGELPARKAPANEEEIKRLLSQLDEIERARVIGYMQGLIAARRMQ